MHLELGIEPKQFGDQLAREIAAGGLTVVDLIERLVVEHLEDSVSQALGDRLIKAPRAIVHPGYYRNRFENLQHLRAEGYSTWYPKLIFATGKSDALTVSEVTAAGFDMGYIKYGGGIELSYRYMSKELKTQVNHTVQLNILTISALTFEYAAQILEQGSEIEQPYIANLAVGFHNFIDDRIEGFRVVSFDHVITGRRAFCSCHRVAHEAMLADIKARAISYVRDSWPYRTISLLESAAYGDELCHFCVANRHGEDAVADWYGAQIRTHFGPYVDFLVRSTEMDERTATAEAKRRLSISRWVREDELYGLVARLFPRNTIRREASPSWLGQQRLDIYLPELKLAIEHQGEQHYRPVGAFGGEQAFPRTQERDERKRTLCQEHGVTVVDIRFDAPLTLPSLRSRLRRWID